MNDAVLANWLELIKRMPSLLFGLFLFAAGVVANLNSGLGMGSWGVLSVGLTMNLPLSLGEATQISGLVVLILGWVLGSPPGLGTLANMYFIGLFIDLILAWELIPQPTTLPLQLLLLLAGIALIGVASFFYLRVQLGAGPRDGLMMGLIKRLSWPVSAIRGTIEVIVTATGYLLGGHVGIGTVITALVTGYAIQLAFSAGGFKPREKEQVDLFSLIRYLSGRGSFPK